MRQVPYFIVILLLFKGHSSAQLQGSFFDKGLQLKSPFTIQQFSNQDGLPQSQVYRLLPLNDRSLLLSTGVAPVIFDGYNIQRILPKSQETGFFNKIWYASFEDKVYGIGFNDGQLKCLYPEFNTVTSKYAPFFSLLVAGDSLLLLNTRGELVSYAQGQKEMRLLGHFGPEFKKTEMQNPQLFILNEKRLYCQVPTGVLCYDLVSNMVKKISDQHYELFASNPFDHLFIGIRKGKIVDLLNGEKIIRSLPTQDANAVALSICFIEEEKEYIVGTMRGLCFIHDDYEELYNKSDGLPSEYCNSLYYDQDQGCLYVGTGEKGLLKLQFKSSYSFATEQNFRSSSSIIRLKSGKTIFINEFKQICQIHSDTSSVYINGGAIFASLAEIDGYLFAGTWGNGVRIYKDNLLVDSIKKPQISNLQVLACYQAKNGQIWIGNSEGISSGTSYKDIKPLEHLKINGDVICFYELRDGTICIGTTKGAYFVKAGKEVFSYEPKEDQRGTEVRCFYEDKEGKVWMGTYGKGILVKEGQRVSALSERKNCLIDQDVFCLANDHQGYLYSTSNHGLWRISEKSLQDFYKKKINYLVPFYYGEEEGILNTEFNGGFQNNFLQVHDHFYFPSIEGVVMCMPETLINHGIAPRIDKVWINDTVFSLKDHELSRKTNSVRFDFSCTNLSRKQNIYFQHQLIGGPTSAWSPLQRGHSVNLQLLPPGHYTFVVRAIDGFNEINPNETFYAFSIVPYFYETTWFKTLVVLLLVLVTGLAVRIRTKFQRTKEAEKERYSRAIAEIEIKAIQAQLNPHFVFNCLNTIKSLILQKDFDKANKSLNTFSSLTREMLENSDKIFIPFLQNLKFCTEYIQLEKLRFQELFEYHITYDPELNNNPLIPHQLVQPYVENAIKHGLSHIEGRKGILNLDFSKTKEAIVCRISDNGIGRKISKKLNEGRIHHSLGTELTIEKTEFLKRYINYNCTIEVTDLYFNDGESAGTEIIIQMPYVNENWNN